LRPAQEKSENPILINKLGMVVYAFEPSYKEAVSRRIAGPGQNMRTYVKLRQKSLGAWLEG
jgi:hypothetical protein